MSKAKELEEIYGTMPWPEDPWSKEGRSRYEEALERFKRLTSQEWISSLISKRSRISILDICGGTGIGGIALAKALSESGKHVDLKITDLRKSALKTAIKFGKEVKVSVKVEQVDALRVHEIGEKYDIGLLYGNSTPHFNPWRLVRLFASVSNSITEDGVFIVDEVDKIYILLIRGYELILPEASKERVVISMHSNYDPISGEIRRLEFDLVRNLRAELPLYFWGLAEVMAIAWLFFKDVDFLKDEDGKRGQCRGLIVAHKPRKRINPDDLTHNPKVLLED
ncbi:MAG: methyltransferase domain-containing protein [Nitrososphaerota archaeon]|nr:methyltransferase domain-containing protein [Nitrososphaerota archaeon]